LQTVSLAVGWIEGGDQQLWGGGYWLPIERGVGLFIPGVRRDIATDPRAMGEVLLSRASGLGGSAVAESFYNFGPAGALVFVVFGYLLGYIELAAHSPYTLAWGGVILYALTLEIRNWFISVPAMIVVGSIPILIGYCLRERRRNTSSSMMSFGEKQLYLRAVHSTLTSVK
jgi:hypothetical protein